MYTVGWFLFFNMKIFIVDPSILFPIDKKIKYTQFFVDSLRLSRAPKLSTFKNNNTIF